MSHPIRIVVTDCDHDSMAPETEIAAQHGIELVHATCRTEEEVIAAAQGAGGILVQYAPVTGNVLSALPSLRAIGRYGVGVDTVDVAAATSRLVAICNVPDYGIEDVSDHAIALAMTLKRAVVRLDRQIRSGGYDYSVARPLHRTRDQVFGVLGMGRIGMATARKAAGIGFTVIGHDPERTPGSSLDGGLEAVEFEALLARSDVLSIHVPLTAETRHLFGDDTFSRMKEGSALINTARGGIVDTAALLRALSGGRLSGAGLDVFEDEPLAEDSPLRTHDGVVLTPHVAWYSEESFKELKSRTIQNVVDVLSGRRPRDIFNPEILA